MRKKSVPGAAGACSCFLESALAVVTRLFAGRTAAKRRAYRGLSVQCPSLPAFAYQFRSPSSSALRNSCILSRASRASRTPLRVSRLSSICLLKVSSGSSGKSRPTGAADRSSICNAAEVGRWEYDVKTTRVGVSGRDKGATRIGPFMLVAVDALRARIGDDDDPRTAESAVEIDSLSRRGRGREGPASDESVAPYCAPVAMLRESRSFAEKGIHPSIAWRMLRAREKTRKNHEQKAASTKMQELGVLFVHRTRSQIVTRD